MKAIVKTAPGPGNVEVRDVPVPEIEPHEILVRVRGTGICGTDILIYDWSYRGRAPVPTPIVLGHEGGGDVVEVGAQVDNVAPGDRVALDALIGCGTCYYCNQGLTNLCRDWAHLGISFDGTYSEYLSIPAIAAHHVPDSVGWEDAAFVEPLGIVAHALERAPISPGDSVVVVGPGPLGLLALQAARAAGAAQTIVTGLARDRARLDVARRLGADHVVVADEGPAVEQVRDLTGGLGADVVIEAGGTPEAVSQAIAMARGYGQVALVGFAPTAEVGPLDIVRNYLKIVGIVGGLPRHAERALRWLESGQVRAAPIVTHRLPLEEAEQGFQLMKDSTAAKVFFAP
jgi:2-desacetyl-2-hydroxyethyl bacteriochlorophyllide A dehydrogenase